MVEKQYYSIKEACIVLSLTRQSLARAIENGSIKSIKVNGVYRIPINQFHIKGD